VLAICCDGSDMSAALTALTFNRLNLINVMIFVFMKGYKEQSSLISNVQDQYNKFSGLRCLHNLYDSLITRLTGVSQRSTLGTKVYIQILH